MLDGNDDDQQRKPTINESYAGAVSTGKTRVQPHYTQADLIAAAGMNRHRMGMALMRLASEWNSGATPAQRQEPEVKALGRQLAEQRARKAMEEGDKLRDEAGEQRLRVAQKAARIAAASPTKADMELAHQELARLQARSVDWNVEENKLRFQRLKTLPSVRAGLIFWVTEKGWEDPEHLVAAILQHFLSPNCPTCNGSGKQIVPGTLGREALKRCPECARRARDKSKRTFEWGKLPVRHGGRGLRLLDYLEDCVATAGADLREGAHREHRRPASIEAREKQRAHDQTDKERRADAEVKADEARDSGAIAAHFRSSMGRKRP